MITHTPKPTRSFPHKVNEALPKVSLRMLEREIYDVEKIRVVFRGNPRVIAHYGYLARFHLPLAATGELTVRRFIKRIRWYLDTPGVEGCEIIVPLWNVNSSGARTKLVGFRPVEAKLSNSPYWPFKGYDPLKSLQMD